MADYEQGELRDYEPKHGGPETIIVIRTPTERTRRKIMNKISECIDSDAITKEVVAFMKEHPGGDSELLAQQSFIRRFNQAFASNTDWMEFAIGLCVAEIKSYEHRQKVIVTAENLVEYGDLELVKEVAQEIFDETSLAPVQKKTSARSSKSKAKSGGRSRGTASHAGSKGSPKKGAATKARRSPKR